MNVVITGGSGFIGIKLIKSLLTNFKSIETIKILDKVINNHDVTDKRVSFISGDITNKADVYSVISDETTHVFHFAAIMSSHSEEDFDLGMAVNLYGTQCLLEACRQKNPSIRFVFSSSLAVFGGNIPDCIESMTATQPQSSYGTQKSMCELLVNDYGRRGLVDALAVRLPTICIREGVNKGAAYYVSGISREIADGNEFVCPFDKDLPLWVSSPAVVVKNIQHTMSLSKEHLDRFRVFNLPGISVTPQNMVQIVDDYFDGTRKHLISYREDDSIARLVNTWPKRFNITPELELGFTVDASFLDILKQYLNVH